MSEISLRCSVTLQIILSFLYLFVYEVTAHIATYKKITFCKLQKILDQWNTLYSHFQAGSAVALSCHSKNRCCKSIPRWLYFASTLAGGSAALSSEETLKALCACAGLYYCSKRELWWWRCIAYSSSSLQVKVFQPLPWMGVSSFLSIQDQGFVYASVWVNVCSGSSLSCW